MFSKTLSATAVALAASALVSAQTFTECDPTKQPCRPDPAFGSRVECDFTRGPCDIFNGATLQHNSNGAVFTIQKDKESPTLHTGKYIFFGRIDVVCQAAAGQGIVTSAVLQSDDLDEIDWEWVGGDNAQAQSNYFSKGDTTVYDRGAYHPVANPVGQFHKYSIEWTSKAVVWLIDDKPVRTLTYESAKGGSAFPQTPMQIKLGTWVAGGPDSPKGTAQWAGGYTDFSKAPFNAYYKSITIVDYAGRDQPRNGGVKEYVYGDRTGSFQSIRVVDGQSNGGNDASENGNPNDGIGNGSSSHNEVKSLVEQNGNSVASSGSTTATSGALVTSGSNTGFQTTISSPFGSNTTATSAPFGGGAASTPSNGASPGSTAVPASAPRRDAAAYGPILLAIAGAVAGQLLL